MTWTPVETSVPPKGEYLVTTAGGNIRVATFRSNGSCVTSQGATVRATAWMALPAPYVKDGAK